MNLRANDPTVTQPATSTKRKKKAKDKAKAKKKKKKAKKRTQAQKADRHLLYQEAVQAPEADETFFTTTFQHVRKRKPMSLREDFCGSAFLSSTWVKSDDARTAQGIDLDAEVLAWGQEHNVAPLGEAASRLKLHEANVLEGVGEPADIVCAMNFSYQVFKTRQDLLEYFKVARSMLVDDGVFFAELYGGFEAACEIEEDRKCPGFTYIWEQKSFNVIDHHTLCHIHFRFKDGSRIKKAFTYDWRLWSIPELRELLTEAGFTDVEIYWEITDKDGDGTGEFKATQEEENQESWLIYLAALK